MHAGTGGFVTGPAAIDGVVDRDQARRRLDERRGARRADGEVQEGADDLRARQLLAEAATRVFGRQYRVIKIQDNKPKLVGTVVAKVVPKI